ncbi:MAG: hypothetical protein ACI3XE_02555 [Eubacteriales bacterium]
MKGYLVSMVLTLGVAALASLVTPEGKTKKYMHFLLSLAVVTVLVTPLVGGLANFSTLSEPGTAGAGDSQTENPSAESEDAVLSAVSLVLRDRLVESCSLTPSEVAVTVGGKTDASGALRVSRVTVTLTGKSAAKRLAVLDYLKENLTECEVRVYVEK